MNSDTNLWFPLTWPENVASTAEPPEALMSLAAAGDFCIRPEPDDHVWDELGALGIARDQFFWLDQDHTRIVFNVDDDDARGLAGDGMITRSPCSAKRLGVTVADCMPVFLWDTATGARGLCHSGWKGTGIAADAVRLMQSAFGSRPENIAAILGPSIRTCCYAVPEDRARAFESQFGRPEPAAGRRGDQWYIDLAAANRNVLAAVGVRHIHTHDECTCCDSASPGGSRFSSFRRQGKEHFTRMLAVL